MKFKYSLGCAFTVHNLFDNFSYSKLQITCEQCKQAVGDIHKQALARKVFRASFELIVRDIIERNVTFWFPLTGNKKCNMHMKRVTGKDFQLARKAGKWGDVDFLNSNFSGYEIGFYMLGKRTPRVKTVYVDKQFKNKITKYTNEGKQYGDGLIDTKISDYHKQMFDLFPDVPQHDIKVILNYSWKSLYLHNSYGGDVLIKTHDVWFYIGKLKNNPLEHYVYYKRKLIVKLRVLYKRKKIPWNGYYYFALSDIKYEQYLKQKKTTGRPRKHFDIAPIMIYKILDECKLSEHLYKYIFRIPMVTTVGIKCYLKKLNAVPELIEVIPPRKFKDILVNDNEYEFL